MSRWPRRPGRSSRRLSWACSERHIVAARPIGPMSGPVVHEPYPGSRLRPLQDRSEALDMARNEVSQTWFAVAPDDMSKICAVRHPRRPIRDR